MREKQDAVSETHLRDGLPEMGAKAGTESDREAMQRLGKKQLFKRNFNFISVLGFAMIFLQTWEGVLQFVAFGLGNGGPSGLIYTYIVAFLGFTCVAVSMAEMASAAPTSGGQYHWISELAPRSIQKPLSFTAGWLGVLGYQVGITIGAFWAGTAIQGLVVLNHPNYDYRRWHGTLIAMGITLLVAGFNIFLAKFLPLVETLILVLHLVGWIAVIVPLWVLAPKTTDDSVWNSFVDPGWNSIGTACLIGLLTSVSAFIGSDAPAHIAEEVKNASKVLPQVMIWCVFLNGILGFVVLVTFCYCVGNVEAALTSPTGYPIIEVFYVALGRGGATALTAMLIVFSIVNNLTNMASGSRQLFAFARDKGVPAHIWLSKVPEGWDVPINAIILSTLIACVLHCINIGSAVAFNIILSMGVVALLTTYMISIGCVTWRRVRGLPLLPGYFTLGRLGLPVNLFSMAVLFVACIFSFFPPIPNPPAIAMNWSVVVYCGVLFFAVIYYLTHARRHYDGPVEYVNRSI